MAAQEPEELKQFTQAEMKEYIENMQKEKKEKAHEEKLVHCKVVSDIECVNIDAII